MTNLDNLCGKDFSGSGIQRKMTIQESGRLVGLQPSPRLQASTISRIHHAREILLFCLENPPSLLKLAQQVGVSDTCGKLR